MGQPAARVSDTHPEGAILQGSADVLIGSLKAARLEDPVRHGDGVDAIIEGEPTVLINGRPAARQGDLVSCEDPILTGCATVHIGKNRRDECIKAAAQAGAAFVAGL